MKRPKLFPRTLAILQRLPKATTHGVEVGVRNGVNAAGLLAARPLMRLLLVDRWATYAPQSSYYKADDIGKMSRRQWEAALMTTRDAVEPFGGRATLVVADTQRAAMWVADRSLDFCFLDDDHTFEGVERSLDAWFPKIRVGGWIGGHDYEHPCRMWNVKGAIMKFRKTAPVDRLDLDNGFTWFLTKVEK